jgi:HEAT repeat protein
MQFSRLPARLPNRSLSLVVAGLYLIAISAISVKSPKSASGADPIVSADKERELIALLRSESPPAEKAIACKLLAIHGSAESVPDLARLLENEQLASWARIALEVIPGPETDAALRQATNSITGTLLVGTINSIGVRRDKDAVELLTARLQDPDSEVASAAAVALGRIGNPAAAQALRPLIATAPANVRSAVAEGAVLCAERFLADGKRDDAIALYDQVRQADVPRQRIVEATRGAILARQPDAGIALLIEQLNSKDPALFQIGLTTAREFPGSAIDKALADELSRTVPERAPLVIMAMADRKETVVLSAILNAVGQGPKSVRLAAIGALGRVGNDSCVPRLLVVGIESDDEIAETAKRALSELQGTSVDEAIVSRLPKAEGKLYPLLIEIVGQRRISAVPELQKALDHSDKTVRSAALKSLGATVPPASLSVLVDQVVKPRHAEDTDAAKQALMVASIRMPDREACAAELTTALERSPVPTKTALLQILGAVGGTNALKAVGASAKSSEPELQDAASRLLGEWMTIDAAPVLLDLANTAPEDKYKVRALRGYIRIARQFIMPIPERVQMCRLALEATSNIGEQKLVLEVLKRYPSLDSLKLAFTLAREVPELKDDAHQAATAIVQKLGDKGAKAAAILSKGGLDKVKLEIVKAEYGAGETQKDVTEVLQKQAGDLQLISLTQDTYNASFGGDPAPNIVKTLKVDYRINGKDGQATFSENALILLPMPK